MNGGGLSAEEREALARTVTLHKAARATTVAGELRWICDGCGQPLAPSEPNAAFADLTVHQSVMLDDLFESFLAARASDGLADKVRALADEWEADGGAEPFAWNRLRALVDGDPTP